MALARPERRRRARRKILETPPAILDAAMEGAREAMRSGPQGYPFEDIEVVITGIEYRPDASTPGGPEGRRGRGPAPGLARRRHAPARADHEGRGDRARAERGRRARRSQRAPRARSRTSASAATQRVILAKVPLRRMFGYSTDLRSRDPGPRQLLDAVRQLRRLGMSVGGADPSHSSHGPTPVTEEGRASKARAPGARELGEEDPHRERLPLARHEGGAAPSCVDSGDGS